MSEVSGDKLINIIKNNDSKKNVSDHSRINFHIRIKKIKRNKILIDDGKFTFVVTGKV